MGTSATWSGPVAGSVGRAYDANLRLVTLTVNGQDPLSFGYDQDSLLVQAGALALALDPQNGRVTGTSLSNVSDTRTYNGFGERTGYTAAYGADVFYALQNTRDKLGRIATKTETIGGVTDTYDYAYTAAGRLSDVTRKWGGCSRITSTT